MAEETQTVVVEMQRDPVWNASRRLIEVFGFFSLWDVRWLAGTHRAERAEDLTSTEGELHSSWMSSCSVFPVHCRNRERFSFRVQQNNIRTQKSSRSGKGTKNVLAANEQELNRASNYIPLSVCLSVYSHVCLSVYSHVCLSGWLSIHMSVCLCLSICLTVHPNVYLSICLSVFLYLSVCQLTSISLCFYLSTILSITFSYLSICLFICLSMPMHMSVSLYLSVCACLSICLFLSVYLSHMWPESQHELFVSSCSSECITDLTLRPWQIKIN